MQHLPAFLFSADQFRRSLRERSMSVAETAPTQTMLRVGITKLEEQLHQWKRTWADTYPAGQAVEVPRREEDDQFPIFRCRDLRVRRPQDPRLPGRPRRRGHVSVLDLAVDPRGVGHARARRRHPPARPVHLRVQHLPQCRVLRADDTGAVRLPDRDPAVRRAGLLWRELRGEARFVKEELRAIGTRLQVPLFLTLAPEISARTQ